MRIWKGTEREDNEHKMTLFVESQIVDGHVVKVVKEMINQHPDVERVYFGAGGVTNPDTTYLSCCGDLSDIKLEKVVEVHSAHVGFVDFKKFDKVILTTPVPQLEKVVPKIETATRLEVFSSPMLVDFSEVENGCYNNDVEVYKE